MHVRACMVNNSYIRIFTKTYLNKGGVMRKSYQETKSHETLSYKPTLVVLSSLKVGSTYHRLQSSCLNLQNRSSGIGSCGMVSERENPFGVTYLEKYLRTF